MAQLVFCMALDGEDSDQRVVVLEISRLLLVSLSLDATLLPAISTIFDAMLTLVTELQFVNSLLIFEFQLSCHCNTPAIGHS